MASPDDDLIGKKLDSDVSLKGHRGLPPALLLILISIIMVLNQSDRIVLKNQWTQKAGCLLGRG
jgi:hypothetical protein